MTFLLSEDKALAEHLRGMVVHDQVTDGADPATVRPVIVRFGQPDQELSKQIYPYITIDMVDLQKDSTREMRGKVKPKYLPDPTTVTDPNNPAGATYDPALHTWVIDYPIPVNIDYQITTWSRHPRHDREILSQLLTTKLPLRLGQLSLDDGTVRRLEVLDYTKRDVTEQAKRLFVNAVTVRVSSEVVQSALSTTYKAQEIQVPEPIVTNNNPLNLA